MPILCEKRPQFSVRKLPPVFNKRLFKAQAGIVLTDKILDILQRPSTAQRSTNELHAIKPVVSALKDIHKGLQFIKEALGHVVTYEKVEADVEICKKQEESCLSCYYILSGSVEVKYAINNDVSGAHTTAKANDCEINYTHVAGEYLGLVSGDGREFDYPPPDNIRTMEVTEFLRVDRERFHSAIKRVQNRYVQEIRVFIEEVSALKALPKEEKNKLVALMARQEYPAGKVIINQGDLPEHLFFVAKGRCQYYRSILIDEVNREELVKLGQIEKGEFFGESTLLDSSPCFCSVASIGPVTCFLVNKWVLKSNESVIQILRQNRRYFFNDDDIKHYIRDSDVWQSFKRCTMTGLLQMAGKCDASVDKSEMTPTLSRAVDYGDAKRDVLKKPNHDDEIPGKPKEAEKLFVPPRSRRRSSAILNCSAAAVVKAVLLLRKNSDDDADNNFSFPFPAKPSSTPAKGYQRRKLQERSKSPLVGRRPKTVRSQQGKDASKRCSNGRVSVFGSGNEASPRTNIKSQNKIGTSGNDNCKKKLLNRETTKKKSKADSKVPLNAKNTKEATINVGSRTNSPSFLPSVAMERNVAPKPNVVIKEIINTGIPGRRFSPKSFRRFERSLFDVLDNPPNYGHSSSDEESFSATKSSVLNPWNISLVASKWMSNVRQAQRTKNSHSPEAILDETGQPPIIVIEDWAPGAALGEPESAETDAQLSTNRKAPTKRTSRTPTPILDDVTEESEEEIQKYEHELMPSQRWYTPIHEAHDACKQHLIEFKKDVEHLEQQRKSFQKQHKNKAGEEAEEEKKCEEEAEKERVDTSSKKTPDENTSEEAYRPTTGQSRHLRRQVSISNSVGRSRARTYSEVPLEHRGSSNELRRTQSLNRFRLISVSAPNKMSPSLERAPAGLEDQDEIETMHGTIQKNAAKVKHDEL